MIKNKGKHRGGDSKYRELQEGTNDYNREVYAYQSHKLQDEHPFLVVKVVLLLTILLASTCLSPPSLLPFLPGVVAPLLFDCLTRQVEVVLFLYMFAHLELSSSVHCKNVHTKTEQLQYFITIIEGNRVV